MSLIEEWNQERNLARWLMLEDLVNLRNCYPADVWRCKHC
jgi:hypothetical protein